MSEGPKGIDREEVAARRAALTDGRWRNREGIGMYQRSTSNALRNILSGVRSALPSLSRAKSKSRSRSNSPIKPRTPAKRSPAKRSPIKRSPTKRSPAKRTSLIPEEIVEAPEASSSKLPPFRSPSPVPEVESIADSLPHASPVRDCPKANRVEKAETKKASKLKAKSGLKLQQGSDVGPKSKPTPALLKKPAASEPEKEEVDLGAVIEETEPGDEEDEPVKTVSKPSTTMPQGAGRTEVDESVVIFDDSVVLEEPQPELQPEPKPKTKSRIQTIIPEPLQRITQKVAKPRAVSGSKRPSPDDENEASDVDSSGKAGGSATKRAKTDKGKGKSKASAKKGKPRKTATKPKGKASKTKSKARAVSSQPEPSGSNESAYHIVPTSPTPAPQDIMVPLQDSPPSRPKDKGKRRRYTLMPVRTTEEMAHPDFDPIDCIGWQ